MKAVIAQTSAAAAAQMRALTPMTEDEAANTDATRAQVPSALESSFTFPNATAPIAFSAIYPNPGGAALLVKVERLSTVAVQR